MPQHPKSRTQCVRRFCEHPIANEVEVKHSSVQYLETASTENIQEWGCDIKWIWSLRSAFQNTQNHPGEKKGWAQLQISSLVDQALQKGTFITFFWYVVQQKWQRALKLAASTLRMG